MARACFSLAIATCISAGNPSLAQEKLPVTPADYGQWEILVGSGGGVGFRDYRPLQPDLGWALSPDGQWLSYEIDRVDGDNELRIVKLSSGATTVASFGLHAVFSADSRWLAYGIAVSDVYSVAEAEKTPVPCRMGLLDLQSGQTVIIDDIESFAFSADGSHLAMQGHRSKAGVARLTVRNLGDATDQILENVSEFVWQDEGRLLAVAVNGATVNSIQVFDPTLRRFRVLDASGSTYRGLAWRQSADDLVALRSRADEHHEGPAYSLLSWTGLTGAKEAKHLYEPSSDSHFPEGMRIVSFRKPSWSDDGAMIFIGVGEWKQKLSPVTQTGGDKSEEPSTVEVWHWRDVEVMPVQKIHAAKDREKNLLAVWHVKSGLFLQIAREYSEDVTPIPRHHVAYALTWTPYAMERSWGRRNTYDLSLINLDTGERTQIAKRVTDNPVSDTALTGALAPSVWASGTSFSVSPGGRYVLFFDNGHYQALNTSTGKITNITQGVATSFMIGDEWDYPVNPKPAYGIAGWGPNDQYVILYDKFDLWQVSLIGLPGKCLTDGAAQQLQYRYTGLQGSNLQANTVSLGIETNSNQISQTNFQIRAIDPAKPLYLTLKNDRTKWFGYARLTLGASGATERLVWVDELLEGLTKAKRADVYAYVKESFENSPNIFIGWRKLNDAKQVTATNPFQTRYAWGRAEVIEYQSDRGQQLHSALFYPANYQPGHTYPMIVNVYEHRSDEVRGYSVPSLRTDYNAAVFTSLGYFVLAPDLNYRPREPGVSTVEGVSPAVRKVIQMGLVDAKRIGVVGHSTGAFEAQFLATHTNLFAAAVASSGITDWVSNYGDNHWGSGVAETDHAEVCCQRMEVPFWDDLDAYIRNSSLLGVQNMTTPLLLISGDADGSVDWHQSKELYNAARRAQKNVVFLVYPGEDHFFAKKPNQLDFHQRIIEWLGHYLKDEPAPTWITNGVPYLERQTDIQHSRRSASSGSGDHSQAVPCSKSGG
jgi:dienelactone hydrolase